MTEQAQSSMIRLTNAQGDWLLTEFSKSEPNPGSVVLTSGVHGTAWQRHFRDGWWYCTGRVEAARWEWLVQQRNLVLIYDAPERD